jgi:hypothetical protein
VANSKISGACGPGMSLALTKVLTRLMILHCNKVRVVWYDAGVIVAGYGRYVMKLKLSGSAARC